MSRKRILLLSAGSLFLIVVSGGLVLKSRADHDWNRLHERIDDIQVEIEERGSSRPVLHAHPNSDEAFAHYLRAIELADEVLEGRGLKRRSWDQCLQLTQQEWAESAARLQELGEVLHELRLGAQAGRAKLFDSWDAENRDWETHVDFPALWPGSARKLSNIAFQAFMAELQQGDPQEAVWILLDSLQFARDLACTPLLLESATGVELLVHDGLIAFGEAGGWTSLPPESLNTCIDALATIDEGLETVGDALRVDTLLTIRSLKSVLTEAESGPFRWNLPAGPLVACLTSAIKSETHRSHELLLDFARDYREAFATQPKVAPLRVRNQYRARAAELGAYAESPLTDLEEASIERLRGLARLRLLRYALASQAGRRDVPETDRTGLPIQERVEAGMRRVFVDTHCAGEVELSVRLN